MFDTLRAWRARRAVYSRLVALARRSAGAAQDVSGDAWLAPHALGFVATLVTSLAEREVGTLAPHAMASVQAWVLKRLTGLEGVVIGEQLALLSGLAEPGFLAGCAAAQACLDEVPAPSDASEDAAFSASLPPSLLDFWRDHVTSRLRPDLDR